ncbi:hypothetical protein E0500_042645 [Streptomyces sp. KM273126]|nr:hypothetical protein [Streptomyces sp. KM273126]MBA2813834.1 hypothetical protein [Streptomyces sp. KM273126]
MANGRTAHVATDDFTHSVAFNPDGKVLASATDDNSGGVGGLWLWTLQ